jgi:hypothetical protein
LHRASQEKLFTTQPEVAAQHGQAKAAQADQASGVMGDGKLTPEEKQARGQMAADAIDVVSLNDLGKTQQAGARGAAYIQQIAAGNAVVVPHPSDPAYVIADVGGKKIKLPAMSYTVNLYTKAKAQPAKK